MDVEPAESPQLTVSTQHTEPVKTEVSPKKSNKGKNAAPQNDEPLTSAAEIAKYIQVRTGANAPPLASWHYCGCDVVTKVKPKKSNKVMMREAEARKAKIEFIKSEAARMEIPPDNPQLIAQLEAISVVPPRKEKPKELDEPCDYKVKNRNGMRVHLKKMHSVYYCGYCRTRWNKPQKQKWKEHKMKFPSGQCRFTANGGKGPGKSVDSGNSANVPTLAEQTLAIPSKDSSLAEQTLAIPSKDITIPAKEDPTV